MKKIFSISVVLFLIFLTTFIKNSTNELDEKIYNSKERISFLKNTENSLTLFKPIFSQGGCYPPLKR